MKQVMQVALMVTLAVLSMACQGQMNLRLDNNFGLPIYKNLGLIERRPLGVGLMIDEESKNAQVEFVSHNIHYTIALGEAGEWLPISDQPAWKPTVWPVEAEVVGEVRWMARTL